MAGKVEAKEVEDLAAAAMVVAKVVAVVAAMGGVEMEVVLVVQAAAVRRGRNLRQKADSGLRSRPSKS